ncbi:hypothetical protein EVAR_14226_1 [Eumeta japonica]|uniref:Uncharacterized protein n=1 Tax=Eumeta variegata TaxID=151549 RepID=A0A4C1UFY7_EUMVA|nr:hypothetical protein EVAR_14226_1 [Eumeta japonica]
MKAQGVPDALIQIVEDIKGVSAGVRSPTRVSETFKLLHGVTSRKEVNIKFSGILRRMETRIRSNGLCNSRNKTEHLECRHSIGTWHPQTICLQGKPLSKVPQFKNLWAVLSLDIGIEIDVTCHNDAAWQRCPAFTRGRRDERIPIKTKDNVRKPAIRPFLMYGAESWVITKLYERKVNINVNRILR